MFSRVPRTMSKAFTAVILLLLISFATTHAGSSAHDSQTVPAQGPAAVGITASKTDTLIDDVNNNTLVDPGDTLEYSIVVANNGDEDALDTTFTDITDDAEITVVAGSLRATPIGRNDAYDVIGNTQITHPTGTGLTANDLDPDGGTLTASCTLCTTSEGGTVSLSSDGSFSYTPSVGFTGTDTFTYTVTDPDGLTDTGTVTFTVADRIWWVDSDAAGAGSGTSTDPFQALTSAQAASSSNDVVFVFNRSANYTDGFTMDDRERLCGHGSSLQTCSGITPPAGTTFPAVAANPTIINASGAGIALAQNNTIYGITVGSTAGTGITGTNFGTLTGQNLTINTGSGALSLNTGTANVTFNTITSSGGANNINLSAVGGTLTLGSGALSGSTSHAFLVNGGTAPISYTGTIGNSTADAVNIQNKTGGTVTLSGSVTNTGTGISLINNTGATINFTGGIALTTTGNEAFTARGGGTFSVTGSTNTINATNATALNVANTTIAASGLNFLSISSSGATRGITLNNTGASGGLTVTGTGTTDSSGGVINNISQRGIELISARNISLANMTLTNANTANGAVSDGTLGGNENTDEHGAIHLQSVVNVSLTNVDINGSAQHGINGNTVTNLDISSSVIQNTGNAIWESGIYIFHLFGLPGASADNVFNNITVQDTGQFNVYIQNGSPTNAAPGEMDRLTFSNSTFNDSGNSVAGDHITVANRNNANFHTVVTGSTFTAVAGQTSDSIQIDAGNTSRSDVDISGSSFSNGNIAINLSGSGTSLTTFEVENNPLITNQAGNTVNIASNASASLQGHITNNTISTVAANNAGSGIDIVVDQTGSAVVDINGNTITGQSTGIRAGARNTGTGTADITIRNNTVTSGGSFPFTGVYLFAGNASGGETNNVCINFSANTVDTTSAFDSDYFLEQYAGNTFRLQGLTPPTGATEAQVEAFIASTDLDPSPTDPTVEAFGGLIVNYIAGTCAVSPVAALETDKAGTVNEQPETAVAVTQHHTTTKLALTAVKPDYVLKSETFTAFAPDAPQATTTFDPFTLPAGESTTITFRVMINDPFLAANNPICNQATISGSNFSDVLSDDPDVVGSSDSTCTTVNISADLSISKTDGLTTAVSGTAVTYTIVASNAGPHPDPAAVVTDNFPAAITGITWTCADAGGATCTAAGSGNINETVNLPVGGSVTFTASGTIDPAAIGTLANTAAVAASTGITDPVPANNSATDTNTLTPEADLSISKTDSADPVDATTGFSYTLDVANNGPSTATSVSVEDTLPAGVGFVSASGTGWTCGEAAGVVTCTQPALAPGAAPAITINVTAPAEGGVLSNTAVVSSAVTDPGSGNDSDTETTTVTPVADLAITKSDSADPVNAGAAFSYTLDVTNSGPTTATSVTVGDTLPAGVGFVSASGTGWTCGEAAGVVTCTRPTLAPGAAPAITINVTASTEGGNLSNTATVSAAENDPATGNNSDTETTAVTAQADVSITKTDGQTTGVPGTGITYTIVASNAGPSSAASVTIADTFPAALTGVTWTCVGAGGGTCAAGSGNINDTANLPAGGSVTYTANATIAASATGTLSNTATAAVGGGVTDPTPGNNSATDTTTLTLQADLSITKTDGLTAALPGQPVTYTITVNNAGPSTAVNATVADTFSADLTGISWTCTSAGGASCTAAGSGDIADAVTLPPSSSLTYVIEATIDAGASADTLVNTATITAPGDVTDPDTDNNSSTDSTSLDAPPEITNLTVTPGTINENDTVDLSVTFLDPNTLETHEVVIDWGDGISETINLPLGTFTTSANHTYLDDNPTSTPSDDYTVTVTVTEPDGGTDSDTAVITVNNVAPSLFSISATDVSENGLTTLSGTISDPGTQDTFTLLVDWGDGSSETFDYGAGTAIFSETHTYEDDDPTGTPADLYTVTLTLTDDDTGSANDTTSLTVQNEAPLVDAGVNMSVVVSTTVAFNGSFTDVGTLDTHTIDWDFGDGVTASGTLTPSHTFTAEGVYTVTLTVTDDDTGVASDSLIVTVTDGSTQVYVYLPIVMVGSSTPPGPDLVVSSLTASGSDITVVVTNQGDTAVTDAFWVDVYIDPNPIPTMVNQTWTMLADQGLVWGVDNVTLNPGQSLTLTINGAHYQANLSNFSGNLLPGTPVYAQVDSANATTTFGAVLENHENSGGVYNNITGTTAQ